MNAKQLAITSHHGRSAWSMRVFAASTLVSRISEAPSALPDAASGVTVWSDVDVTAARRSRSSLIAMRIGVRSTAADSQKSTLAGTCHSEPGAASKTPS